MLSKGRARAGAAVVTREVTPPPLADLDLTKIDDRGGAGDRARARRAQGGAHDLVRSTSARRWACSARGTSRRAPSS